jgi:hypothetical protein
MPREIPDRVRDAALAALQERTGTEDLELRGARQDTVPSTGARIFSFSGVPGGEPNAAPVGSIAVDEKGRPVDVAELSRREAKDFFTPEVPVVAASLLEPHVVKIDPPRDDLTLDDCDTLTETITVTIPPTGLVTKADVYFLADTTASMDDLLAAVQGGAGAILGALTAPGIDFAFGVGNYKDFPRELSAYAFQHQLAPTANAADVQAAINAWSASGGGDTPEGQLFALDALAEAPGGAIGWRPDSKRIIVWFGDAPGHDPVCAAVSGLPFDITEVSVTKKLVGQQISVIAIDTGDGTIGSPGLDTDPAPQSTDYGPCGPPGGSAGQAGRIATATGGAFAAGIDPTTVVTTIIELVKAVVGAIKNVRLVADGAIVPFVTSISPEGGYGPLRGDETHVLTFTVSFAGGAVDCARRAQVFAGSLDVVVDGAVAARKPTVVTVPACRYVYAVKFVCGDQPECGCECAPVRPGTYATEINVYNGDCADARVALRVIPLVLSGAPVGRAPNVVPGRPANGVALPSGSATMLDCCRLTELLLGAAAPAPGPLSIGYLELVSSVPLDVTAVYTATATGGGPSIQVLPVTARAV